MTLHKKIQILSGDITKLEVHAIVNAANSSLLGGGVVEVFITSVPILKKDNFKKDVTLIKAK